MTQGIAYSIISRLRTPLVNPGNKIEVEIYLSGYGEPKQNKFNVAYSSPYVINKQNPGKIQSAIAVAKNAKTGQVVQPVSGGQYVKEHGLKEFGVTIILNEGYFLPVPREKAETVEQAFPILMSEQVWGGHPPLLLTLNVAETAPSGDHNVYLTLTYGDEQQILQDQKCVTFHVTSWWERRKSLIGIIGLVLAVPAFVGGIISLIQFLQRIADPAS